VKVKVLHVLEAIETGVARHVRNLVRHVDAEHIVVLPPGRVGGATDTAAFVEMEAAGAQLERVDMRRSPVNPHTLRAIPVIHRMIRLVGPDVVHGHSTIGGALARLAATGTGVARVYTPNGLYPSRTVHVVERALGRLTDCMIAVSPSEAALVQRLRLVSADRIVVIPNAVDLDPPGPATVDLRARLGVGPTTPLVGTVGRLAPQKAPEIFIHACRRVADIRPDARFVLVGDGPLAREVSSELAATGIPDRFLLLRDCLDAETLMTQFDVFALPSRYEGATYAVMEAMRVGTPVIVSDVVGNRDAVEAGRSGLFVPADDPAALAEAMHLLLDDPDLRHRMGEAARARVVERFDIRAAGGALARLYESLARRHRSC
jgi:glycosyltransferase involved in cell wall biosynthesis